MSLPIVCEKVGQLFRGDVLSLAKRVIFRIRRKSSCRRCEYEKTKIDQNLSTARRQIFFPTLDNQFFEYSIF